MARYSEGHKTATRQRILDSAGRQFKDSGINGSGIASVMTAAGLTNGAFYAHFDSKDDLVASVIEEQMSAQVATVRSLPPGLAGLELFVREYLTPEHRDNPSAGCPSAALLDEVARCSATAKHAYTASTSAIIAEVASRLEAPNPKEARERAIGLYAIIVGTLQLARAIEDDALSRQVLASGITNASSLFT